MIMKRSISSLLFLTVFVISIQQGVSTKCYVCSSSEEKDDCWASPEKATQEECGASVTPTPPPGTGTPGTVTAAPGTPATAAPGTPGTAPPGTPATAAPGTPGTAAPGTPGTAAPGTPGTAAPGTPGTAAPGTPGTAAPGTPGTAAPGTPGTAAPGTPGTAAPAPAIRKDDRLTEADQKAIEIRNRVNEYLKSRNLTDFPSSSRRRRSADDEWECLKLVTKDGDKKKVERKCAKKTEKSCENKKNTDGESCNLCSDKDLCNSASSLKLQLIPAFLSVFVALFLSSR